MCSKSATLMKSKTPTLARDPVCGMELEITKAFATATHRGTTYYFDSNDCAMKFGANPDVYVNPPEVA